MSYSFKKSVVALGVTSFTGCVAFLANGFSPIMPLRAIGIYAAIIVPVNALLIAWMLPPMIITY